MDIKNKVALITGGASGLGFASAQKLIAAGAKIMVMDLNEDNAKKACSELDGETDYAVANVAEEASVQEAINKTLEKFGKILLFLRLKLEHLICCIKMLVIKNQIKII